MPSDKQAATNRLTYLLGIAPVDIGGRQSGTVPARVFEAAATAVGIRHRSRTATAETVVTMAGMEWKRHYDSRDTNSAGGGNVTVPGLWAMAEALEILSANAPAGETADGHDDYVEEDPEPPRVTSGQRRMVDAERRLKVEMAAQDWLMDFFYQRGWHVKDTHIGNPYDAIARRGNEVLFLEAKGTTTSGDSVIVTRNEVAWARQYPNQCYIGVWAGIQFDEYGEVIPNSGYQTVQRFNPYDEDLDPIAFDYRMEWP